MHNTSSSIYLSHFLFSSVSARNRNRSINEMERETEVGGTEESAEREWNESSEHENKSDLFPNIDVHSGNEFKL